MRYYVHINDSYTCSFKLLCLWWPYIVYRKAHNMTVKERGHCHTIQPHCSWRNVRTYNIMSRTWWLHASYVHDNHTVHCIWESLGQRWNMDTVTPYIRSTLQPKGCVYISRSLLHAHSGNIILYTWDALRGIQILQGTHSNGKVWLIHGYQTQSYRKQFYNIPQFLLALCHCFHYITTTTKLLWYQKVRIDRIMLWT